MDFEEHHIESRNRGWIEVITGSMFSGKTEELIRRLKRAQIAGLKVEIFKPGIDTRYSELDVVSHDQNTIQSTTVSASRNILLMVSGVDVVGLDEAQFFDMGLIEVCTSLANQGIRVIAAGLDMDYLGNPFGPIPSLMAEAEYVTKVHAICVRCGSLANYSFRKTGQEEQVYIGAREEYEPLCRRCFNKAMKAREEQMKK